VYLHDSWIIKRNNCAGEMKTIGCGTKR